MFITKDDFDSSIYNEILQALTRDDENYKTLEDWILVSVEEMAGYLNARYDTSKIFAATGSARNASVLARAKHIVLYYVHSKGNPRNIPDIRVKLYDDTIEWLKSVRDGEIVPPGLPILEKEDGGSQVLRFGGNTPRNNHY